MTYVFKHKSYPPLNLLLYISGCSAAGSALDWGSRGRKFKSCHSDQSEKELPRGVLFLLYMEIKLLGVYMNHSFSRSIGLLGEEGIEKLNNSSVIVKLILGIMYSPPYSFTEKYCATTSFCNEYCSTM